MLLAVCAHPRTKPGSSQEELNQAQRSNERLLPNHDYAGVPELEPAEGGVYTCPGMSGGVEWDVPAYSPKLDLLVVLAVDWRSWVRQR